VSVPLRAGEGCGNTFVLAREADLRAAGVGAAEEAGFARRACGARDGLLVLGDALADGAAPARILHRDGSAGGTCLNGLRVAACASGAGAGVFLMDGRRVRWRRAPGGGFALALGALDGVAFRRVTAGGREGVAVDFWNPHAVFATGEVDGFPLAALAAQCDADRAAFPAGVNVEIVNDWRAAPVRARVRERGVGETRACGSGAAAIALAAWAGGRTGPLEVRMPGGTLRLERAADGTVELAGDASVTPYSAEA
jgi:diaminopimelate epimerase